MIKLRTTATMLACLVLASCTASNHIQSQSRLDAGVANVFKARTVAYARAKSRAGQNASHDAGTVPTLLGAKTALAQDAANDLEVATSITSDLSTEDKISYLYRAATKAWHAGSDGDLIALNIYNAGVNACSELGDSAPPRDCAMLEAVVALTKAQRATDSIIEVQLKSLRGGVENLAPADIKSLIESYASLKDAILLKPAENGSPLTRGMNELEVGKDNNILKPFINAQMLIYRCYATVARTVLANKSKPGTPRRGANSLIVNRSASDSERMALKNLLGAETMHLSDKITNGRLALNNALDARGFDAFLTNDRAECGRVATAAQNANAKFLGLSKEVTKPNF